MFIINNDQVFLSQTIYNLSQMYKQCKPCLLFYILRKFAYKPVSLHFNSSHRIKKRMLSYLKYFRNC